MTRWLFLFLALTFPAVAQQPNCAGQPLNLTGATQVLNPATLFSRKWAVVPPMNQTAPYAWGNPGLSLSTPWISGYANIMATTPAGKQTLAWSTLGGELEAYPTATQVAAGSNPYSGPTTGPLTIQPRLLTASEKASMASNSSLANAQWLSGAGITFPAGLPPPSYFEFTARIPKEQGQWPAFWLLGADDAWPPEIDIMEGINPSGATVLTMTTSIHTTDTTWTAKLPTTTTYIGTGTATQTIATTYDPSAGQHRYGALIYPGFISIFWDGVCVQTWPMPSDLAAKVVYPLFDLAVGASGSWAGTPSAGTAALSPMVISNVAAYVMPATYGGSGGFTAAQQAAITAVTNDLARIQVDFSAMKQAIGAQ